MHLLRPLSPPPASMRESPFQMTPSQSKMNVSTESTSEDLSSSLRMLASALAAMARRGARTACARAERTEAPRTADLADTRAATDEAAAARDDISWDV